MEYTWFMAASIAAWLGMCAYVLFIARAQSSLQKRLRQWELLQDTPEQAPEQAQGGK